MKHVTKKLTALVLAALLVLSLGVSAWATEGTEAAGRVPLANKKATITIDDVKADETAVVYQLVSYNDTYTNYEFESNFKTFLETKAGKTGDQQNDIATYFAKQSAPDTTKLIEEFVTLCNTADSGYTRPAEYTHAVAAGTSVDVQVEPGYYMIIMETSVNASRIYQPITVFVRVDADKLHIYTGGSATPTTGTAATVKTKSVVGPTIDKKVWCETHNEWATTTDAGVGRTVKYYVVIDLPKYNSVSTLDMTVNDKMTGLKYVGGSAKVYEQAPVGDQFTGTPVADAVAEPTVDETDSSVLHFALDYSKIALAEAETAITAKQVWLYYEAVVTDDALANHAATNSATLTYANAATKREQVTEPVSTMVFNYALNLQKQSDRGVSLSGAKFTLYKDEAMTQPIYFVPIENANGNVYRVGAQDEAGAITEIAADFDLLGLSTGTAYIKETTVPTGYFAPASGFKLVLASELSGVTTLHTGSLRTTGENPSSLTAMDENDKDLILTAAVETSSPHAYRVILRNSTTPILPSTGGMGTALFTVGGIALMVLAAFLFLRRKNKEN